MAWTNPWVSGDITKLDLGIIEILTYSLELLLYTIYLRMLVVIWEFGDCPLKSTMRAV